MRKKFRSPLVVLVVLMMLASIVLAEAEVNLIEVTNIDTDNRIYIDAGAFDDIDVKFTATGGKIPSKQASNGYIKLPESFKIFNDGTIGSGPLVEKFFAPEQLFEQNNQTLTFDIEIGVEENVPAGSYVINLSTFLVKGDQVELFVTVPSVTVVVGPTAASTYTLTMDVSPAGSGTAIDLTGVSPYVEGTVVNIQAVANPGYAFVNWTAPAGTFGDASSASTTLTMPATDVTVTANFQSTLTAPEVIVHPADREITYGANTNFSADADGNPTPTVRWEVSTDGGENWDDVSGETNKTLTLTAPTVAMSGNQYRAVFDNSEGDATTGAATLTVNPAQLTVTADDKTVIYGDATPDLTYQIIGFVLGELEENVVTGAPDLDTDYFEGTPVADSPVDITVSKGDLAADNYSFTFVEGEITIEKASLTVTADDKTVTYGDPTPPLTYEITGFVLGQNDSVVSGDPVINTAYEACTPVSASQVEITLAIGTLVADNYEFTTLTSGWITIEKRSLTVTADDKTKIIGAADPDLTYQITAGSLADCDEVYGELKRVAGEDVDNYAINQGTLLIRNKSTQVDAIANYDFTFIGGKLYIQYDFGGFLPPINKVPNNLFKKNSTIPVKFQLTDANGDYISDAVASIYVVKNGNDAPTGVPADPDDYSDGASTGAANTDNFFRYDTVEQQYIFNLGTNKLGTGNFWLLVQLNDGTFKSVKIALK